MTIDTYRSNDDFTFSVKTMGIPFLFSRVGWAGGEEDWKSRGSCSERSVVDGDIDKNDPGFVFGPQL